MMASTAVRMMGSVPALDAGKLRRAFSAPRRIGVVRAPAGRTSVLQVRAMAFPELSEHAFSVARDLHLFHLADVLQDPGVQDAILPASNAVTEVTSGTAGEFVKQQDWLTGFADVLEFILKGIDGALSSLNVPYAYGFSIIILTLFVKILTFPATKIQVESSLAMQDLQPKLKAIQEKYKNDQERISVETQRLYQQAGVNPLAGCVPALATIPIFLGLYRTLTNVAGEGELTAGFFWIPSLAGPASLADREGGTGLSWLFPFVDGHPPLGWEVSAAYLVLPILLLVSQYLSMKTLQPATQNSQAQGSTPKWLLVVLPFVTSFFALTVPSGLSLYWFVNNVFSTLQQVYLRNYGGAKRETQLAQIIDAGQAKRSSSSSAVVTAEDKEQDRQRAEQFKALKERERARKAAAFKAAEEAARTSSAKVDAARARLEEGVTEAQNGTASTGESDESGEDGDDGKEVPQGGSRRTKRSKRTRRA